MAILVRNADWISNVFAPGEICGKERVSIATISHAQAIMGKNYGNPGGSP